MAAETRSYGAVYLDNESFNVAVVPELSGRIVRLTAKRAGHEVPLLTKPWEGAYPAWERYPDLAGQVAHATADYPVYAWPATWKAVMAAPQEALVSGKCPNGLTMERRVRIDRDWVHTLLTARNPTHSPLEAVLVMQAELECGDIDSARVQFRSAGGAAVDKQLIIAGEPPEGSETYKAAELPDGEWRLVRSSLGEVVNRFPRELVDRVTLSWTAKGGGHVTLAVWSKKQALAQGQELKLATDYR